MTGGNKGIGLAICRGLLQNGKFVFLGSRDRERGVAAVKTLVKDDKSFANRVRMVPLDVCSSTSITAAVTAVKESGVKLNGIINNAGGTSGMGYTDHFDHEATIKLNYFGSKNVTEAFLPLLAPEESRVVLVSSGAASKFVASASKEMINRFVNPQITETEIEEVLAKCSAISSIEDGGVRSKAFEEYGVGSCSSYGLSKACLTAYGMALAPKYPNVKINSCTPGFVETDLTRPWAVDRGTTPQDMGMISTEQGARTPLFLMLGDVPTLPGESWYYGSDAKRSPLHKYRDPGSPPFDGKLD